MAAQWKAIWQIKRHFPSHHPFSKTNNRLEIWDFSMNEMEKHFNNFRVVWLLLLLYNVKFVVIFLIIKAILLFFCWFMHETLLVIKQIINRNHLLYSLHDTKFPTVSLSRKCLENEVFMLLLFLLCWKIYTFDYGFLYNHGNHDVIFFLIEANENCSRLFKLWVP